jgi:crotonobetainyl-CoA:carnitine CoA-transferase CaiB-like acyl-CoA transferase
MTATEPVRGPLAGIRVLDFSRVIAGPLCTQTLSDLGAEVIKLENPQGGDDTRGNFPPGAAGEAHFFLAFNRGKKSLAIDLSKPEAKEIVHALAAKCDALVQNFRPGVMEKLGFGYDVMHEAHPQLIYLSVSAYGQTGPMSHRPGFDPVLQAEFGLMAMTGEAEGPPLRHPISILDTMTALHASTAIVTALWSRRETGRGQHIDLALMDTAVAALGNAGMYYLTSGEMPPRSGNAHPVSTPTNTLTCSDGPIYIAMSSDKLFGQLCRKVLNRPDIAEDPKFLTRPARTKNRAELYALLDSLFIHDTRANWAAKMRDLPAGPVRTMAEALESPEVAHRNMVRTIEHPKAGPLRIIGSPLKFSDTPVVEPVAPPLLGQHTDSVLTELLGYDAEKIASLRAAKVVA